ncbi:helix-turn-helix transcriptional regulator [Aureimonas jatrophae]|uniref:DNA-binding transcriptional regulator, CsgD family n=1 Tax=Aureimonas jatrophae TaxID=1166073 RepID=A0A1H0K2S7_9HYPH|nr:helix-turn-helix transcriptional regulator [Aureimonas jatrophae]MBB3950924.1 DNA-binding CsgD family transcriptional regulator [Aureimonas jatrophae]SDO50358.1 DNA-binding transcriptional regulator, CsgD family [Aureimonas jatrophae]
MRHDLSETLDLIGEASVDGTLWREVTERVLEHTRAAAGAIYVQSRQPETPSLPPTEFGHMLNYGAGWIESYFQHYAAGNPYLNRPELREPGRIITEADCRGPLAVGERELVADWQEAQGFHHVIAQFLQDRDDGTLTFVFWRDRAAGAASSREQAEFDLLARAVNRAVRAGDRLRQATAELRATTSALDQLDVAVITLGPDGRVRGTNGAADALLAARDGLVARWGRLEAAHAQDQGSFERFVADALAARVRPGSDDPTIRLRRVGGRPPWRLSAVAVQRGLPTFNLDRGVAVVLTLRTDAGPQGAQALARTFDLTPAETRLALLLVQPLSLAEAASQLGIRHETARSHLKSLFNKTGTHGQTELVVRLLSGTK